MDMEQPLRTSKWCMDKVHKYMEVYIDGQNQVQF